MLFTVVGDPHARPDNLDKINTLFDIIEELGNECVILGDLLDTKELVRASCLNTYLKRMKASKLKYWVLVGNHDWTSLQCEEHSLEALKELPNVTVVDGAQIYENIAFCPYIHNPVELKNVIEWVQDLDVVLFCHADIKSFDFGNGMISDVGLDVSAFKSLRRVISGHYHKYQEQGNITYLGTPFSHSFGETNQTKYIGVYDTEKDQFELIETPFPQHMTDIIDCSKQDRQKWVDEGNIVRVILKGTQEEIDKFQRVEGVKYIEQPITEVKASVINETQTPQDQFSKWASDVKGYSKDILDLGLEILKNV